MQLEIPLSEVQQFISDQYNINVYLKNIEVNKIKVTYIDSVVLIIDEVKEEVIYIHYEVDGLATIVTKIAHLFLKKKLGKTPIEWDPRKRELKIDLNRFTKLNTFIKFATILKLHFTEDTIVLEMHLRGKT